MKVGDPVLQKMLDDRCARSPEFAKAMKEIEEQGRLFIAEFLRLRYNREPTEQEIIDTEKMLEAMSVARVQGENVMDFMSAPTKQ